MAFTPSTMATTLSMSRSFGLRQAAPMQKRCDPAALASAAAASTACTSISFSAFTSLSAEALCEQYPQSSGQPPVLIEHKVHSCTSSAA